MTSTLFPNLALSGDLGGRPCRFRLRPTLQRIGSLSSNDIVLDVDGVSRRHAVLVADGPRLLLEDLASKNGTWVNGARLESPREVNAGDHLRFGSVTLELETLESLDEDLAIVLHGLQPSTHPHPTDRTTSHQAATVSADSDPLPGLVPPPGFVLGTSPAMQTVLQHLQVVAPSDLSVLLIGDTGVGKEGLARTLHASSERANGPFVAINCAAIPTDLLEAELFGIGERVATGVAGREGCFQRAVGGTLFLDEIGEMPAVVQAKLLRALQEREVQPVGRDPEPVDLRLVAATNTSLQERIAEGTFRRDLYFRLAGLLVRVPPLSERREDVAGLVEHFLRRYAGEAGRKIAGITTRALGRLMMRPWPGNVRQLENEIRRLVYLCPDYWAIDAAMLTDTDEELVLDPARTSSDPTSNPPADVLDFSRLPTLELAAIEKELVREALRRSGGNKSQAARLMGITREAVRRRIARHGL